MDDNRRNAGMLIGLGTPMLIGLADAAMWFEHGDRMRGLFAMVVFALALWGFVSISDAFQELDRCQRVLRKHGLSQFD